jgi:hypothetical protein
MLNYRSFEHCQEKTMTKHRCNGGLWRVALLSAALVVVTGMPVWAQSAGSTIHGTVKDESGGAVPGVTVTLSSPALQVGQLTVVTDADGNYRFGELPAGTYRITYELAGFKTYVVSELRLTIGFVARADATMAVGGLEESITVTGASPVVDLTTTTTSVNLTKETLESVPLGRGLQQLFAMTPGVTTNRVDVGDSWMGVRASTENYGPSANAKIQVDGIDVADGTSTGVYLSSMTLEEAQIRTSGNDAEVSVPGVSMVAVIKSGSNQFHGSFLVEGERPELQSNNLSDRLQAQGLSDTEPLRHLYDVTVDLGGRLVRDKLWFYGAFSRQDKLAGVVGFAAGPGPDGKYLTGDEPLADVRTRLTHGALKFSYQPTDSNRLIAAWQPTMKYQPQGLPPEPNRFRPLEATLDYRNPSGMYKGELQSTLSNRMVFNVVAGYGGYIADYAPWRTKFGSPAVQGNPTRFDRETTLNTGSNGKTNLEYRDKWQVDGGISIFPEKFLGGQHELKTGTTIYWRRNSVGWRTHPAGNYTLVFDRVGGVSGQPAEIQIRNSPTQPVARADYYAGYVKDTWRVTDHMTLNLGVRLEQQRAFLPEQSKEASPDFPTLFPAASYPALDVLTWNSIVPRLGLAWDLANKTVVKATFGRYGNGLSDSFANSYNPLANVTMTYRWRDLNGNRDYNPGEVNLDPNGADFLGVTGTSSARLNKDLQQPMTTEATVSVEREVMHNLGVRALYVFKKITDQYETTNVARPRSAYNIPLTRRDPGPDGVLNTADDGGRVTIYDYDRAFFGAAFVSNELQNSDRDDDYQTIEFTLTKRASGRWSAMASFWAVKYHAWITSPAAQTARLPDNPNNDLYPMDEAWRWAGNFSGSYQMPWGVQFGAFVQSKIGLLGQRTNIFRAVDPDGGPRLNQLSTVTLRLEPFGSQKSPAINVVNLRTSKQFSLTAGHRLEFDFDLFNLFNSSAPISATFQSGPTFNYATAVVPARVARIGFKYSF